MPVKAAVVNFLASSKAFDFLPRGAFGDYVKLPKAFSTRSSSGQRAGADCFWARARVNEHMSCTALLEHRSGL
jgi:hypothetical protein